MKKFYSGLIATVAIGAAATTLLATVTPERRVLRADKQEVDIFVPSTKANSVRVPAKASEDAKIYWTKAVSCYNAEGNADFGNGVVHQYGTTIQIDGNRAIIHGLIDLCFGEIDEEYAIEGVYNDITNTITITTGEFDPDREMDDCVKVAEVYNAGANVTAVLLAGDMADDYSIPTQDELVLKFSDDMSTITSRTGFGAFVFNENGEALGVYDFYRSGVTMTVAQPDAPLTVSTENINFSGLFVFQGLPVRQSITIGNPSSENVAFSIEASSPDLSVSVDNGVLAPCSQRSVEVTLLPSNAGVFDGTLTISSSDSDVINTVSVNVEVWEQPDYAKITKDGSQKMDFMMSPAYPYVISEYEGHIVAMSTNNGEGDNTESWFSCNVDIPAGKTGVFTWDAIQIAQQPNSLVIFVDKAPVKSNTASQTVEPQDMSGAVILPSGLHEIAFVNSIQMDWSVYGIPCVSYVWNVDCQLTDDKPNSAILLESTADFGEVYFDKLSVSTHTSVTLVNSGSEPLKVINITSTGNFSGTVPSMSVPKGGEIEVPLTWTAQSLGEDKGDVLISTTAGAFTVSCVGMSKANPYDYSTIVTEGDISFTTDVKWPFIPSGNGKYFYNSSSKADIDGVTYSWLEASFEVPDGMVGIISWEAVNESENMFVMMDTPSLISGTIITIDDKEEEWIGGVGIDCSSNKVFTPESLALKHGRHSVKFNYKKTSNDESYIFGDDRVILSNISLELVSAEDFKGLLSEELVKYPKGIYVGCVGHYPITLYNYGNNDPELISCESDGPFSVRSLGVEDNNLNLMVEFKPTTNKEYKADLKLVTNIGEFTLECSGNGKKLNIGEVIFYEGFEYDFENNWIISDINNDGNTWKAISPYVEELKYYKSTPYEGNDGLFIMAYNTNDYERYEIDDVASTPQIAIPEDGVTTLQFQLRSYSYALQSLMVMAGEGDDPSAYQLLKEFSYEYPTIDWDTQTIDLSCFAGKKIRVAFKTNKMSDLFILDDVLVATTGTVGVSAINGYASVVSEEYYTLSGVRCDNPSNGVYVVRTRYSDGKVSTRKVLVD